MTNRFIKSIALTIILCSLWACGGGGGGGGATAQDPETPTTPDGLTSQVISTSQIDLTWNPSSDDVAVLGYYLYRAGTTATSFSTSYAVTGLSPDTQYCFSVAAFDADGNISAQSASVCATTDAPPASAWTTVRSGTNNDLANLVWTGDSLLVVEETFGSSTQVHVSTDGANWNSYPTSGFGFHGATDLVYGNNRFVAADGWPFTSPDGVAWELIADMDFEGQALAWSPSAALFVAVGDAGYIGTSPDGRSWTRVDPAPTTADLRGVAWLNDRLFALDSGGGILTSSDGHNWTSASTPGTPFGLDSIAWNGQSGAAARYVATGYSTAFISNDGDSWSAAAAPPTGFNDALAWGGGAANCFVAVGSDNHIFSSPDGETWTRRFLSTAPGSAQLQLFDVTWTGTGFVVVGERGTILTSADGASWSLTASGTDLNGLAHDGSRFIAVGDFGRLAVSSDAANWEYRHTGDDAHYLTDLVFDGSRYIATGQTYTLYSDDLSLWQASWEGATSIDTAVVWDGSQFVRTGNGIMSWDGVSYYTGSSDPDWAWSYFSSTEWFNDLLWDGGSFVAVGNGGIIYTSPDATDGSWTARPSGTTSHLNGVAEGAGRLVAVGADGTILSSDDSGLSWTARDSGVTATIHDVSWTGSQFVAVGYYGLILTSSDGSSWNAASHGSRTLYSVLSNGSDTVIVGAAGTIIRNSP